MINQGNLVEGEQPQQQPGEDDPDQGDDNDELTEEQSKLINKKILHSIKMFRKHYNMTEG